jgi:hypothetical protein
MGWLPKGVVLSLLRKLMSACLLLPQKKCRSVSPQGGGLEYGSILLAGEGFFAFPLRGGPGCGIKFIESQKSDVRSNGPRVAAVIPDIPALGGRFPMRIVGQATPEGNGGSREHQSSEESP